MLYQIDLSGALLCYGPLAVMIIGFIAFAWITDADARRSYLRRIDMRTEDEAPQVLPPVVTERTRAQTPSGSWVTLVPPGLEANGNGTASVAFANPAAPAPAPAASTTSATDDFKRIDGIGPKIEGVLKAAGYNTFSDIANATEETLRQTIEDAGISLAPNLATWPSQAAQLAAQ